MPRTWRITKAKYAGSAFDGEGARLYGGRWSSPGTRVVYVADSLALATLEVLVHLQHPPTLAEYVVFSVDFPDKSVKELADADLPANWRQSPSPPENQSIGDAWARRGRSLALRLPSVITIHEYNYLLNPEHPDFRRVKISKPVPWDVDPRVFGR